MKSNDMQFVITAYDGQGMLEKRMEVRPLHLEGMERLKSHLVCAGGLLDDAGRLKGSVLVMEFQNREEVDAYLAGEIYVTEHATGNGFRRADECGLCSGRADRPLNSPR